MKRWQTWITLFFLAVLVFVIPPFVHLQNVYAYRSAHTVVSQQPTTISSRQVIDDALVLGHNVHVAGVVNEALVVIDGDVHLASTARVDIVVDLGGRVYFDPGAHVHEMMHLSLSTPFWNGALFGGVAILLLWCGTFLVSLGLVLIVVAIAWGLRKYAERPLEALERSVRRTGFAGLLTSVLTLAVSGLLVATLIGIPLAAMLVVLYLVMGIIGLSVVSIWLGEVFFRERLQDRPYWIHALAGASLLMAFSNIPLVGYVLFFIMWNVAIGVSMIWFWKLWISRRKRGKTS